LGVSRQGEFKKPSLQKCRIFIDVLIAFLDVSWQGESKNSKQKIQKRRLALVLVLF
jgi:hypothetical protein